MSERTHLSRRGQPGPSRRAASLIGLCLASLLALLVVACEDETPTGPGAVGDGPGAVTVTKTTTSTTTSTIEPTTTTTTVPGGEVLRFVGLQAPPEAPNDMTLIVQLIPAEGVAASLLGRVPGVMQADPPESRYSVEGVYQTGSGTSGEVKGELGGSPDPLELGGQFEGTLTANLEDCTAERQFSGALSRLFVEWTGGDTVRDCPGSPLSFPALKLVHTDAPPPTTTIGPTTTTTSTTTTPLVCDFSLSPTSATIGPQGGSGEVVIATTGGCNWTAQSLADWITLRPPLSGNRPGKVVYDVSATTAAREGTLLIAGIPFVVTQTGP
ncbi:MAG: hypothetical protein GEV06_23290 [Luteitalea sp.]|nr:hypothetical protein [Luteitalea sp.]